MWKVLFGLLFLLGWLLGLIIDHEEAQLKTCNAKGGVYFKGVCLRIAGAGMTVEQINLKEK
jgi:hypothetical protein